MRPIRARGARILMRATGAISRPAANRASDRYDTRSIDDRAWTEPYERSGVIGFVWTFSGSVSASIEPPSGASHSGVLAFDRCRNATPAGEISQIPELVASRRILSLAGPRETSVWTVEILAKPAKTGGHSS